MRIISRLADLKSMVGQELAVSNWLTVDQQRINQFADATGDHQWIHVDPDRAASGPFGVPIAHGFLTLSMLPWFIQDALRFDDVRMSVNYGLNRVRFTSPVPVGSALRARLRLMSADDVAGNGMQITLEAIIERRGADKPVCIAETISRRYV
jgi:acyl dehydratase